MRARPWIRSVAALTVLAVVPWVARHGAPLLDDALYGGALDWLRAPLGGILGAFQMTLGASVGLTFSALAFLGPVGAIVRMLARAKSRAGMGDMLAGPRSWIAKHRRATEGIVVGIIALWSALVSTRIHGNFMDVAAGFLLASLLGGYAQLRLARAGLGALVREEAVTADAPRTGITYDAVARTREASAAIAVVGALSLAMVITVAIVPLPALVRDPRVLAIVGAYVATMLGAAAIFRHASRAAIGLDGVRVYGTSRERFVAYRDLDEVRARGTDIELVARGRVVLALQLHGADAARQTDVLALIHAAIAGAADESHSPSSRLVGASTSEDLVRVIEGASDYRSAALSREQLWAVAEGPGIDAGSRRAAFEALAQSKDAAEQARLRIAIEQCAAPAMHTVLETDEDDEGDRVALRRRAIAR